MLQADGLSRAHLRRLLRAQRRQLSGPEQRKAAQQLYRQLAQHPLFRRARRIALYLPNDGEIDPSPLMHEAWRRGKTLYLPVLSRWPQQQMRFQQVQAQERLVPNRFRIAEPRPERAKQAAAWSLDLLLMPLVGFDAQGGRLGMGGGFYDRCLAFKTRQPRLKPVLLGLAHACQQVDRLPLEAWDIPLQAIVTDQAWYQVASDST